MTGMQQKNLMLSSKNEEYVLLAEKRAIAERLYHVAHAAATLNLKSEGYSIGLIATLAKGDKVASELKFKYDVACAVEKACLESMKDIRVAIDTYRSLLAWEKQERFSTSV